MRRSLEAEAAGWRGAVVMVLEGAGSMARAAAHVYEAAGGIAWVEPQYLDPWGAAVPAFHSRAGRVEPMSGGAWGLRSAGGDLLLFVAPYDPEDHADLVGDSIVWLVGRIDELGLDWQAEREQVRRLAAV